MTLVTWPHAQVPHGVRDFLLLATTAGERVYTAHPPRNRVYPLLVVQAAGYGPLGTDSAIQADEPRVQIDAWADRSEDAAALAAQVFRLLDARFLGAPRFITWQIEDERTPGTFYEMKVERIRRSGGGDVYFDEVAQKYRSTAFYNLKVNL